MQHYGLIPERVEALTSVTTGRSHRFSTPVGLFTYRMIPLEAFRIGMDRVEIDNGRAFLMATPEKALADKLHEGRGMMIQTQKALGNYLEENLRIDPSALRDLKPADLDAIARRYRSIKITLLKDLIRRIRHQTVRGDVHA